MQIERTGAVTDEAISSIRIFDRMPGSQARLVAGVREFSVFIGGMTKRVHVSEASSNV